MQVGKLRAVEIDGATFWYKASWGLAKRLQQEAIAVGYDSEKPMTAQPEVLAAFVAIGEKAVTEAVVRVDGIVDDAGQAVPWESLQLDDLTPEVVKRLQEVIGLALGLNLGGSGEDSVAAVDEGNAGGG